MWPDIRSTSVHNTGKTSATIKITNVNKNQVTIHEVLINKLSTYLLQKFNIQNKSWLQLQRHSSFFSPSPCKGQGPSVLPVEKCQPKEME